MISHWDDARTWRGEKGHIAGTWTSLTGRTSRTVGAKRIQVDAGMWSTPLHLEGAEEEIFYVLGGSGVSVQWEGEGDPVGYAIGAGDCLVHRALENAHTLQAGPDGLDVLAFGQRTPREWHHLAPAGRRGVARRDLGAGRRGGRSSVGPRGCRRPARGAGSSRLARRTSSMSRISRQHERDGATVGRRVRFPGREAGAVRTGIRHAEVFPRKLNAPPHCHSLEEEIFVVLEGDGQLLLWEENGVEEHEVRAGSVVLRAPGTGVAHAFRAGTPG